MQEVTTLFKDLHVKYKGTDYRGVSESTVLGAIRPALIKHGVDISIVKIEQMDSYDPNRMRCKYTIRWTNIDEPTDFIETEAVGDGQDYGDKAPGKANTYALKYTLLKNLLIMTGDDPDLQSSEELLDKMKAKKKQTVTPTKTNNSKYLTKEQSELFGKLIKSNGLSVAEAKKELQKLGIEGRVEIDKLKKADLSKIDIRMVEVINDFLDIYEAE